MELITLVTLNLVLGVGLYIFLYSKFSRLIRDSQGSKLQEKIQRYYNLYLQEANAQIDILDAKSRGLRDLIVRSEKLLGELRAEIMGISELKLELQNLIRDSKGYEDRQWNNQSSIETPSNSKPSLNKLQKISSPSEIASRNFVTSPNLLEEFGKKVKDIIGLDSNIDDVEVRAEKYASTNSYSKTTSSFPSQRIDNTIGGDPFEDLEDDVEDSHLLNSKGGNFLSTLQEKFQDYTDGKISEMPRDEVKISIESILAELPPSATKIDKVVYLLKKDYSHSEISELLDIGTREVSLIETVRLQKTRRV